MKKHLVSVVRWISSLIGQLANKLDAHAAPHITESKTLLSLTKGLYIALNASIEMKKVEFEYNVTDFSSAEFHELWSGLRELGFDPHVVEREAGDFIILNLKRFFGPRATPLSPPHAAGARAEANASVPFVGQGKSAGAGHIAVEETKHDVIYVDFQARRVITTKSAS
jgi:hypothetical protein